MAFSPVRPSPLSPQAVSIHCEHPGSNTVAALVLSPAEASVSWEPRRRDVKREKPVFYAEMWQLYVPQAGVIEGAHYVFIRPAQGELNELVLNVPPGATGATVTNLMETPEGDPLAVTGDVVKVPIHPYEILTIRVNYPGGGQK